MATLNPYFYVFTLFLHACVCKSSTERRFSDFKRCADDECSMLLGRGKAVRDFTGPDCRFLSFKKGETIYVYYKLSGQRSDVWAGSVGNHFGYFPKDYLNVNHIYTEHEFEVPAEETDFVCFDTGLDKFKSYDIDLLLGKSLLIEHENLTEESKEPAQNDAVVSQLPFETETASSESAIHQETDSVESESSLPLEMDSIDSESTTFFESDSESVSLPSETETTRSKSTTLLETDSEDSESTTKLETDSLDSESKMILEADSEDSESTTKLETDSLDSESKTLLEADSVDSESTTNLESDSEDSESETLLEADSVDSESKTLLETDSVDSESKTHLEADSESKLNLENDSVDSESTTNLETDSVDSESTTNLETDSVDSESTTDLETDTVDLESKTLLETDSVDSESTTNLETDSLDSESTTLLETDSVDSESTTNLETDSLDSESKLNLETDSLDSESKLNLETDSLDSESKTLLETDSLDSESKTLLETDSLDSESKTLLETDSVDSESKINLETDSVDSESTTLLESDSEDSESTTDLESDSEDSESTTLLETDSLGSESVESPETETLLSQSMDEKSNSLQPKIKDVSPETTLESTDALQKDPEPKAVQPVEVTEEQTENSLHQESEVTLEDVETEPSDSDVQDIDYSELLHKRSHSQGQFGTEEVTHFEPQEPMKLPIEAQTAGSEIVSEEPAKTEQNYKGIPLQPPDKTLKKVEEDTKNKNMWSTVKDIFKTVHEGEIQRTGSLEGVAKEDMEALLGESNLDTDVKDFTSPKVLNEEIDSEELAVAEEILDPSQLPLDTKTASEDTQDSISAQPKSQDISSEPAVEKHTVGTISSVNVDRMLADEATEEDDLQKLDTDKKEKANEYIEDDLQKAIMNKNGNANKNNEDNDPQKVISIKSEELHESPQTASLLDKTDDQIDNVRNDLLNLLKNTLQSEKQSHREEEPQDQDEMEDDEELLEDENALLSFSKPQLTDVVHESKENEQPEIHVEADISEVSEQNDRVTEPSEVPSSLTSVTREEDHESLEEDGPDHKLEVPFPHEEPVYSDSILRLTILRDHLRDDDMERIQKYLGLKNLFRIEAMFSDLDQEMKSARQLQTDMENIENTLDQIMEASENSILDETEEMLNERDRKAQGLGQLKEPGMYDVEAAILDGFQEIVFSLRQKYSAASDSVPLVEDGQPTSEIDEQNDSEEVKDLVGDVEKIESPESPEIHEEQNESELILNTELNMNAEDLSHSKEMGLEEDGGHFNRNKDAQNGFKDAEEIQKGPHAILENQVDIGFHFEMDQSSGSLETPSVSDFHDTEANNDVISTSTSDELWGLMLLVKEYLGVYAEVVITALPEEWRPGPTFHGLPWEPVLVTAAVGFLTVLMFFWRTLLAIKGRNYQLTEKQLTDKIQRLLREQSDAVNKITELNDMIKEREEQLKSSEKSVSSTQKEMKQLKTHHQKLQSQWEEMSGSISQLNQKIVDTHEENSNLNEKMIKMHQRIEKYQKTLKNYDEERAKVHVLMDEAKLREDALKAQVLSFEKENSALKEQKKSLLRDATDWQEKHENLREEIRVYHQSQKELQDSLVHKENEIDVLSSCIAELNRLGACDAEELQNDDAKMANGEDADKKIDTMRLRIKQMMDVSRIKATLSIVEEERNRYVESLLTEQKSRQELEEQYHKVMHDQMNLKNEKTHLENQFKNLQQRLEITTELYQQKESALQQKLTQEEMERREKETKLCEVDNKAVRSEEEVSALKQKIKDIEEEMQQNERSLKTEVATQEKKAHENWLKARASERALVEERRESANLRQKLVGLRDKIADMEQTSLFKLNSGPPERHMPPMRRGDSYGPSPVSGGAPSPPLMIEGPGRPPSAPVGRRNESFGSRPPSDPHGRFSELGHPLPSRPEMFPPMTSSPCAHDGPMTAPVIEKAEASEQVSSDPVEPLSKSQSQGSFLPSPIRDSPVPPPSAPIKTYGPPVMGGPVPPNGLPPLMIRPPNGHPPMMPPGHPLGPDPRFRPPPMDSYGPPPIGPYGPVPPPFGRGPPMRDMGPLPPPPEFYGPRGLPPRPFLPGPLPPPGAMVPPLYGGRGFPGPPPLTAQTSRDGEENATLANNPPTDHFHQQGAPQDSENSAMAEP
ncbi:transport and Golgi organization protein 1 homolog isoform X2 [Myxocyprinus asiaticus]|uniref:transport and Golgi organization protein 1 homolog isoform X2 n=1 Tax=Myxocyprinus asiaticus TaxID=70543 RepID=UPI002221ABCB|nr:transport and Golgi organization protein 1 homolog isoform X2 [Myxocyprinus asiaticus]